MAESTRNKPSNLSDSRDLGFSNANQRIPRLRKLLTIELKKHFILFNTKIRHNGDIYS